MECKTKGSCKGAAKIRGNSAQTQNIGKGGKGTLANSGKRRKRSASFIGSQTQQNAKGAVGSITNMECKTKGSCKGAAKIRGHSKQTQNIKAGGKGTLANSGKRRKRSPNFIGKQEQKNAGGAVGNIVNMKCNTKGSCKGAAKIRGNSAQTQNIGKGGKGTLSNSGKRRKRSASFIGSQKQANAGGAVGSIVNMECKTKGSCKGAAKIRGNSAQTQNIKAGGKGTLSNSGRRRKRSPSFIGKQTIVNEDGATSSIKDC